MIARCIAVLAIVAQINAYSCNRQPIAYSSSGPYSQKIPMALASDPCDNGMLRRTSAESPMTRNIVAKGKYPVALENCGPVTDRRIPITTSHVRAPLQEKPTVRLAAKIPAPRTVSHSCTCYKTIVKPRVYQQIITVPSVQRYIETSHRPVVENIQYEATPVNCEGSSNCGSQMEPIEMSSVRVPQIQTVEVPQVQTIQIPQVQTVEIPRLQAVEIPQVQTFRLSQVQGFHVPQVLTASVPMTQTLGSDCYCNQF